jgi:hypothetical protein
MGGLGDVCCTCKRLSGLSRNKKGGTAVRKGGRARRWAEYAALTCPWLGNGKGLDRDAACAVVHGDYRTASEGLQYAHPHARTAPTLVSQCMR